MKTAKKFYIIYSFQEKALVRKNNEEFFVGNTVITDRGLFEWDEKKYIVVDTVPKRVVLLGSAEEVNAYFGYKVIKSE